MTEFRDTVEHDRKTQKKIEVPDEKGESEKYRTQTQIGQNALFQKKFFKKATRIMGETNEVMDKKMKFKITKLFRKR